MSLSKYDKSAPFSDPVVRCDSCHRIIVRQHIHVMGSCPYCGNRKVRNVLTMTGEEMEQLKAWHIDPEFIALFKVAAMPDDVAKTAEGGK